MKKITEEFNKLILSEMVITLVFCVLGVVLFFFSDITNKVTGILIGLFFIVYGAFLIFTTIDKIRVRIFKYNLFFGIASFILGIFIMFNPLTLLNFLNISLGIWLIVLAINKIVYFKYIREYEKKGSHILLVSAILLILFGILIILDPFRTVLVTKVVGLFIIAYSILNLNDLVLLKKKSKAFSKVLK